MTQLVRIFEHFILTGPAQAAVKNHMEQWQVYVDDLSKHFKQPTVRKCRFKREFKKPNLKKTAPKVLQPYELK